MSIKKFKLKNSHIKLIKHLRWIIEDNNTIKTLMIDNGKSPYGGLSLIEDIGLILYGKPKEEFDPLSPYGHQYTDKQIKKMKLLYSELDTALEIVLSLATFKPGIYKTKWNQVNWKKIE